MDTLLTNSEAPILESYIIDGLEKLRREEEEPRPQLELPLFPPTTPKPTSDDSGGTVIVLQF